MFNPREQQRARIGAVLLATISAPWDRWDEARRDRLARELYAYQAEAVPVMGLLARRAPPAAVRSWRELPWVPVQVHKRLSAWSSASTGRELRTSGTSGGAVGVMRISREGCELGHAATRAMVRTLVPDACGKRLILGVYPELSRGGANAAALAVAGLFDACGAPGSRFVGTGAELDLAAVIEAMRATTEGATPLMLVGGTAALLDLLERLAGAGLRFRDAPDLVLLDTGGGVRRPPEGARLVDAAEAVLGIGAERCLNVYHITEIATPFLENLARDGLAAGRAKVAPPWTRVRAVDPQDLHELPPGRVGLLRIFDLASIDRPMHVLTDDLGFTLPDGPEGEGHFVLMGRGGEHDLRAAGRVLDRLVREIERLA